MAVVRARSSPPYGLFTVVALAVIATGAAVVFYLMYAKAADELATVNATSSKVGSQADVSAFRAQNPALNDSNASLLSQANKQIKELTEKLNTAQSHLATVTAARDDAEKGKKTAQDLAVSMSSERAASIKQADSERNSLNAVIAELKKQLQQATDSSAQGVAARDKAVTDAQAALNKIVQDMEKLRLEQVIQREEDQTTITKLTAEIQLLRQRIINEGGRGAVSDNVGESDGQVIRVNGATGEVYISLTAKDRIMPGMTFTAYDPRTGVRWGSEEAAEGNGSLEVIEVGQSTSLCRITRTTKNRAIQAGDLIANLVYHNDKTRKFRFTILGNFDLDGDGVATAVERDRIILLIQRWGGQVDDDVTSQTDYLVVGERPATPSVSLDQPTDTPASAPAADAATEPGLVTGGVGAMASKEQNRYDDLIIAAKRLAIPVLNANRFLAMIGYYNTTVVRY
jgi:hypothetical protein